SRTTTGAASSARVAASPARVGRRPCLLEPARGLHVRGAVGALRYARKRGAAARGAAARHAVLLGRVAPGRSLAHHSAAGVLLRPAGIRPLRDAPRPGCLARGPGPTVRRAAGALAPGAT